MLKKPITFEDFNGNTQTKEFYFNLSQREVMKLIAEYGSVEKMEKELNDAVASQDLKRMLDEFERFVKLSYGIKSDDGLEFKKSEEIWEAFEATAPYDAMFEELSTVEGAFIDFLNAVIPKKVLQAIQQQDKPVGPPSS